MTKYQRYGKQLDSLARSSFAEFEIAKSRLDKAKKDLDDCPVKLRIDPLRDGDYLLKRKRREVAYAEAERDFREAQKAYKDTLSKAETIRSELYQELKKDLMVTPEDLDRNVVDLLASGICEPQEISQLFDNAETVTTKRFIAKYADEQSEKLTDRQDAPDREILRRVVHDGRNLGDPNLTDAMQRFDAVSDVLKRCVNNAGLIGYWGQFTETLISEM